MQPVLRYAAGAALCSRNLDRNDDPDRGSTPRRETMRHWITSFRLLTILTIYRRPSDCQSTGPGGQDRRNHNGWHSRYSSAKGMPAPHGPAIATVLETLPDFVANLDFQLLSTR